MKNIGIYCMLLCIVLNVSCKKDLLNTLPKDRLSSELFWKTQEDAIIASNGVYSFLGNQWRYTSMDAFTDIGHFILQWRGESEIEKNTYNASNGVIGGEWSYYYTLIRSSNDFLDKVELINEIDPTIKKRLIAEMKTIRSFAYINLTMLFGDVPLVVKPINVSEAKEITRTPTKEIWDFISKELTDASVDLPGVQEEVGRITKGAALGLKARGMLYAGRFKEAKEAANQVIKMGVYKIHPSYKELFDYAGKNSSEVIFARQYAKDVAAHSIFTFFTANSLFTQACQVVPTKSLVDAYEMKTTGLPIENSASGFNPFKPYENRDPRLKYTVFVSGDILANGKPLNTIPGNGSADDITISAENVTSTGWYFKKWVSNSDFANPWNSGLNLIYLRYAEILLIYAEASIELNEIDDSVLNAINEVRARQDVNMPKVTTTNQSELRERIRRERNVEFAMEGLRLFDIRRWKIAEKVIPGPVKGMTYENPKSPGQLVTVQLSGYVKEFKSDKNYLWPIPFNEILLNKNLTQNKGY